nr:wiskott-Aldrich syndrome protein homolog 1 [Aegilops tauschii subsp. strangulata]
MRLLSSEDPTPPDGFLRDTNDIILHPAAAVPTGPALSVPATGGKLEDDGGFTLVVGRKRKRGNAQATLGPVAPPPAPRHGPPRGWFRHHARPAPPPPSRRIPPAARVRPTATASGPASSRALAPSIPAATASPASSPAPAASIPAATASGPAATPSPIIPQEPDDMEKERSLHLQFREEMSKLKGNKIYCLICYLKRDQKLVTMQNDRDDINHHNSASHKGRLVDCPSKGCLLVATNRHDIGIHAICCHPHML